MKNSNYFDKTKVYEEQISELVERLRIVCNREQMPMFLTVCVANDKNETSYKNEMVGTKSSGLMLTDDKIIRHVNVLNGFHTVPLWEDEEIELETI